MFSRPNSCLWKLANWILLYYFYYLTLSAHYVNYSQTSSLLSFGLTLCRFFFSKYSHANMHIYIKAFSLWSRKSCFKKMKRLLDIKFLSFLATRRTCGPDCGVMGIFCKWALQQIWFFPVNGNPWGQIVSKMEDIIILCTRVSTLSLSFSLGSWATALLCRLLKDYFPPALYSLDLPVVQYVLLRRTLQHCRISLSCNLLLFYVQMDKGRNRSLIE